MSDDVAVVDAPKKRGRPKVTPETVTSSSGGALTQFVVDHGVDAVMVVERHRAAVDGHATLDDARKFYCVSVLDAILTDLRG